MGRGRCSEPHIAAPRHVVGDQQKRAAIECMAGQQHLWDFYTNVAENRGNHFRRNSGGQSGGRNARQAEGFQAVFPQTVDELA